MIEGLIHWAPASWLLKLDTSKSTTSTVCLAHSSSDLQSPAMDLHTLESESFKNSTYEHWWNHWMKPQPIGSWHLRVAAIMSAITISDLSIGNLAPSFSTFPVKVDNLVHLTLYQDCRKNSSIPIWINYCAHPSKTKPNITRIDWGLWQWL